MCGIHLILDKEKQINSPLPISSMMEACIHRGPDHQGYYSIRNVWMAGNRLKIVDSSTAANQPMVSADGRYTLVYNGEIYNYYELRNQLLQKGEHFITRSDTEVLLKLLINEGKQVLTQLNGMFAFVFYDQEKGTLLAARDRFGIKPLYYYEDHGYLIMSSETKCILASGLVNKELNEQQISHYLQYKYTRPGSTFFRNISALLPGHMIEVTPHGEKLIQPFFTKEHPASPSLFKSETNIIDEAEKQLTDAVLKHLAADVPCGLFLSGGIDSTLLLAIIKKEGAHPIPSFSIINHPDDRSFGTQDYYYATKAAEMYGSTHYELELNSQLIEGAWEEFINKIDQPVGDSASLMTYLLAREAKKIVGVVLSGAGADELFAGYNRHQAYHSYLKHHAFITKIRPALKLTRYLPTGFSHPWRKQFRLLKKLSRSLVEDPHTTYQNFLTFNLPFVQQIEKPAPGDILPGNEDFFEQHLQYALKQDLEHYLPFDILNMSDDMSMAQSLEMRIPYLDTQLADFAQQLPATLRLHHGKKWILKKILESYGGKSFTRRSKEGFGLPIGSWLRKKEFHFLRQPLENPGAPLFHFVPFQQIREMLQCHVSRKEDYGQELWALLILSAWLSNHFGNA